MTKRLDQVVAYVRSKPEMGRTMTLQYASKMRRVYGDEASARELEKIAASRTDPIVEAPFFCYECGGAYCEHAPDQGAFEKPLPDFDGEE